jgi:hypothetical protein
MTEQTKAEVTRLRARVRVEAEDVEQRATREQVEDWLRRSGIAEGYGDGWATAAVLIIRMNVPDPAAQWRVLDEMVAGT